MQPLLLAIDDLHWADPASAALLAHLVGPLRSMARIILATYRPEDVARGPLGASLAHLQRHAYHLALAPLDDDAATRLLLRQRPEMELSVQADATRLARGNPL